MALSIHDPHYRRKEAINKAKRTCKLGSGNKKGYGAGISRLLSRNNDIQLSSRKWLYLLGWVPIGRRQLENIMFDGALLPLQILLYQYAVITVRPSLLLHMVQQSSITLVIALMSPATWVGSLRAYVVILPLLLKFSKGSFWAFWSNHNTYATKQMNQLVQYVTDVHGRSRLGSLRFLVGCNSMMCISWRVIICDEYNMMHS